MDKIILASSSPRRKTILKQLHIPFRVIIPRVREDAVTLNAATELARALAGQKAAAVAARLRPGVCRWILGVDTLVTLDGKIFGKPGDRQEAATMLAKLSGRVHQVISGIALLPNPGTGIQSRVVSSDVKFKHMTAKEIDFYLDTGEWQGAAGGYRIQERAALFIESIKGSYSNIVGLPISVFYGMLRENKYNF